MDNGGVLIKLDCKHKDTGGLFIPKSYIEANLNATG